MQKLFLIILLAIVTPKLNAQQFEIEQLLLNVEKLKQFREILQQMYDGYELLEQGYNKVRDIASGNYNLHQAFLDGLFLVNPEIRNYYKVGEIITHQSSIIKEYKSTFSTFKNSNLFTSTQIDYFGKVYKKLFDESVNDLTDLADILTSGKTRMSDEERIRNIDRIHKSVEKKLFFLRRFNSQHAMLAIEKIKEQSEQQTIKALHGLR